MKFSKGFTLIELLVVISIIALLTSIALVAMSNARQKAKTTKVTADFHQILTQIDLARNNSNQVLGGVTGNFCSDCAFRNGVPYNDPTHSADRAALLTSWQNLGVQKIPIDPWGSGYMFDENEHEAGNADCRYDALISPGPDGIDSTADDISTNISHFSCP